MKRFVKFLLPAVVLLAGCAASAPAQTEEAHVFTEEDNLLLEKDVFAKIEEVKKAYAEEKGLEILTEEDFAEMIPEVIQAIEASDTYAEGTLTQNGSVLTWQTTIGMPCTFNPRMEAMAQNFRR
ncbi:MAG: hypothetical protein IKD69_08725 [Solobacterium sp.]|nr:hypothetical protein [Solobacterium sp.]